MSRTQKRRMIFQKHKGGQAHLTKEQIVQLMWKPKKLKLTGSESVDKLLNRK